MPEKNKGKGCITREKAEEGWLYFLMGFEKDCPFDTPEEAKAAWELVKDDFYEDYTIGAIDEHGQIEYSPAAWWMFDCPDAPFEVEPIEGLPYCLQVRQHEALIRWGIIPSGTPDPSLLRRAEEIKRLYDRKMSGNDNYLPFASGTKPEEMEESWQRHLAEYNAWVQLGYLKA